MDAGSGPSAAPGAWQIALEKLGQACGLVCWFVAQARDGPGVRRASSFTPWLDQVTDV